MSKEKNFEIFFFLGGGYKLDRMREEEVYSKCKKHLFLENFIEGIDICAIGYNFSSAGSTGTKVQYGWVFFLRGDTYYLVELKRSGTKLTTILDHTGFLLAKFLNSFMANRWGN